MRKEVWKETLRLLKEIEESVKGILDEAEAELRAMSPQQKLELFGTTDDPILDEWNDLFPIGIDGIEENEEIEEDEVEEEF